MYHSAWQSFLLRSFTHVGYLFKMSIEVSRIQTHWFGLVYPQFSLLGSPSLIYFPEGIFPRGGSLWLIPRIENMNWIPQRNAYLFVASEAHRGFFLSAWPENLDEHLSGSRPHVGSRVLTFAILAHIEECSTFWYFSWLNKIAQIFKAIINILESTSL